MKKLSLTLALLAIGSVAAVAGTTQISSKEMVQQPIAAPQSCFGGWYAGIQLGGEFSSDDNGLFIRETSIGARGNGFVSATSGKDGNGDNGGSFVAGFHVGYNWLFNGGWILGLEGDFNGMGFGQDDRHARARFVSSNSPNLLFVTTADGGNGGDWFATLRPRLGYAFTDRFFAFVTGGLALADGNSTRIDSFGYRTGEINQLDERTVDAFNGNDINVGWTVGAGLEFCVTRNISVTLTYLYVESGNDSGDVDLRYVGAVIPRQFRARVTGLGDDNFHTVQAGVSFHF